MAIASPAAPTVTRADLRRAVADRFGDLVTLTATATGTTTTIIDTLNVNAGAEHYNGRQILFTGGTAGNIGLISRITATADSTGTLTFTPARTATAAADAAELYNRRGIGFTVEEYHRAINNAIADAFPLGMIEMISSVAAVFDADVGTITVPVDVYEVYEVDFRDEDGQWFALPKATRTNENGWRARVDGVIELTGHPAYIADDLTVRLLGYGRQASLTSDSSDCGLNREWVVSRAAYHLALGALMRGPEYGQLAQQFQREAEFTRSRLRIVRHPNSERVRA